MYINISQTFEVDGFIRENCIKKALRRQSTSLMPYYPRGHPITETRYKGSMSKFSIKPPALNRKCFVFYFKLTHIGEWMRNIKIFVFVFLVLMKI